MLRILVLSDSDQRKSELLHIRENRLHTMNAPNEGNRKQTRTSLVKWIVIGIIALSFIFLFQSEIRHLFDRAEDIDLNISSKGVRLKMHHTPIGEVLVSTSTVGRPDLPDAGLHDNKYVNKQHGFELSWPRSWRSSEKMKQIVSQISDRFRSISVPLVVAKKFGKYTPNVIIGVQNGVNIPIAEYIESNARDVERQGGTIQSITIDKATKGGLVVSSRKMMGHILYTLQRYAIADGKGYILTASGLPPEDELTDDLKIELLDILNSFRLIR